jgi:hypothetical protein
MKPSLSKLKMPEKLQFTVIKGKKNQRKIKKVIFGLVCAVLILAIVVINSVFPVGLAESFACMSAVSGKGGGFPVSIEGAATENLYISGNQLLALTDTHLVSYNKNGKKIYQRLHGFAKPKVVTSAARTLVYDRGGSSYRIENASKTVYSGSVDSKIITAAMSKCGSFILVTDSSNDVARATVYNNKNIAVYRYNSSSSQIIGAAISDNGKQIAVATLTTKNAVFLSKILVYDINSTKKAAEFTIKDQLPISIKYTSGNTIRIITDKQINRCFIGSGKVKKVSFGAMRISAYSENENGTLAVGISADTGAKKGKILLLSPSDGVKNEFSVSCNISDIAWSGSKVYVLSDKLYVYNNSGEKLGQNKIGSGALCVESFAGEGAVGYAAQIKLFTK